MAEEESLEEKVKRLEAEIKDLKSKVDRCVVKEEPEANIMMTEPKPAEGEEEAETGEIAIPLPEEETPAEATETAEEEE